MKTHSFNPKLILRVKFLTISLSLFFAFLTIPYQAFTQVYVNEFMASNGTTIADENGDFDDWVELYNAGNSPVNIGGYYVTDDLTDPQVWQIPTTNSTATTIAPGGYLILWFDREMDQGPLHIDAKLGSSGEDIGLFAADGTTLIDSYTFGAQTQDVSEGRSPDGSNNWIFFNTATPGAANEIDQNSGQVEAPVFSVSGGFHNGSVSVNISTATPGASIRYTLDGSEPSENATLYTGTLSFFVNTPLRARAFKSGQIPSKVTTANYLFNINHSFAVIAYSADPDEMFDPETGIYPNYEEDIEINVNAEFYEPNGTLGFNQYLESEIQGTGSAVYPLKSLALKAKSSLGSDVIDYPVFDDLGFDQYRSLTLRNSGQDYGITQFRDAMVTSLVRDLSDVGGIIKAPKMYTQGFRPGVVYLNGDYWGIHNVRERMDKRYLKVHFDLDDNEIDFLENLDEAREGDFVAWDELFDFLENNNLSSGGNYQYVSDRVDLEHYQDYVIFNLYIDSYDWPGNNDRRWRKRADGEKWRWMTWDLDFSFGIFHPGEPWNSAYNEGNGLDRLLNPNGFLWPNPEYATLLFRRLVENEGWRTRFVNRMADQLNVLYDEDRISNRIDDFENMYAPEIQAHSDRWFSGFMPWAQNVNLLRNFAPGRGDIVRNHFIEAFDDITGTGTVTLNLTPADGGQVNFNTVTIGSNNNGWTGTYFKGVSIPVEAVADRGYTFNNWSGGLNGTEAATSFLFNTNNTSITASFILGSTANDPIVINEINYNSPDSPDPGDWVELYNPNSNSVNVSGWYFEDESGRFFGLPNNTVIPAGSYLVLVENRADFDAIYPGVGVVLGDFDFGLSGGGERITLKNAAGDSIDGVEYDDNAPWPTAADGDGPTLQLINPSLDNALASSWQAIPATPGAINIPSNAQNQTINFAAIPDQLTTSPSITLSASATSGLPVSFTLLSGPATLAGNVLSLTGAEGTVSVQASQVGNSQWNPAPSVTRSFNVTEPITGPTDYCDAKGEQPWQEWIERVNFGAIDNETFKEGYGDFTDQFAAVSTGQSYSISLLPGFSYFQWDEYLRVWIDWNGDGDFTDNGEVAFSGIYTADTPGNTSTVNGSIAVPTNAMTGTTRMRVAMQRGSYADPCGAFDFGEVEDYSITISGGNVDPEPQLDCPEDIVITAMPGAVSAVVNFSDATITNVGCGDAVLVQDGGQSSGNAFPIGVSFIQYKVTDACGQEAICSFSITVLEDVITNPGEYCDSQGEEPWQEWIEVVIFGTTNGISNESFKERYGDFTDQSAIVSQGQSVPISITPNYSYFQYDEYVRVWIDYNQDGDFFDAGETVYSGIREAAAPGTLFSLLGTVTIPMDAALGATRMRVSMQRDAYPVPCGTFTLGEVEDYTVIITNNMNNTAQNRDGSTLLFESQIFQGNIVLNWLSTQPALDDHFVLEYAADGLNFTPLTTYEQEENQELTRYMHHQRALKSGKHYFRLRQVFKDGKERYSETQVIEMEEVNDIRVFPNPADEEVYLYVAPYAAQAAKLQVSNVLGEILFQKEYAFLPEEAIHLDIREYKAGIYFMTIQVDNRKLKTLPFIKLD